MSCLFTPNFQLQQQRTGTLELVLKLTSCDRYDPETPQLFSDGQLPNFGLYRSVWSVCIFSFTAVYFYVIFVINISLYGLASTATG